MNNRKPKYQIKEIEKILAEYVNSLQARNRSQTTVTWYTDILREHFSFLKSKNVTMISDIGVRDLDSYLHYLRSRHRWEGNRNIKDDGKNLSPYTIQGHCRAIKAFWSWMKDYGLISDNPLKKYPLPKVPRNKIRIVEPKQFEKLVANIEDSTTTGFMYLCILLLLYDGGFRISEVTEILIQNIDFQRKLILVKGKGKKERYVPLTSKTLREVQHFIRTFRSQICKNGSPYLFPRRDGSPITQNSVQQFLRRLKVKAGMEDTRVYAHLLRHSSATLALRNGADLFDIKERFGHESPATTFKYIHLLPEKLQKRHEKYSPMNNLRTFNNRRNDRKKRKRS